MQIKVKKLPSGYYHIRGIGPCNWAQVQQWPCTLYELRMGNFQGGEDFIESVMKLSLDAWREFPGPPAFA
jgi:hypothetical protein